MKPLLCLLGLAAVLPATAKVIPLKLPPLDAAAPAANKPVKVYIPAGQSNMVGMGDISGLKAPLSQRRAFGGSGPHLRQPAHQRSQAGETRDQECNHLSLRRRA